MAFLTINGVEYLVDASGGAEEVPHDRMIGAEFESFTGGHLSTVRGYKARWPFPLMEMGEAAYAVLKAAASGGASLPCILPNGAAVSCVLHITSAPYVDDWQTNGYLYTPRIELREV